MNPVLFRLLATLVPLQWGQEYARLDKSPASWEFEVLTWAIRLKHSLRIKGATAEPMESASYKRLQQRYVAFSVPEMKFEEVAKENLPPIRLLWVSHPKDFDVLPHSVRGALRHVKNPVIAIDVVSPSPEESRHSLADEIPANTPVSFLHDDDVVSERLRGDLDRALGSHGPWARQQLIKLLVTLSHKAEPTLVVDSDTILLRDKVWMDSEDRQLLYFRGYSNPRYGHYLRSWGIGEIDELRSFVTHHMLFQPKILESALVTTFGSAKPEVLVQAIISSARELGFPEFSLDYEYYGNILWAQGPGGYVKDKYSNVGLERPSNSGNLEQLTADLRNEGLYNSVSFHLPNR